LIDIGVQGLFFFALPYTSCYLNLDTTDLHAQLASRQLYNAQSLWLLTGLANRMGQTIGLHREGSLKGVSPFDTEMRRRLWSQILIMDSRSAQLSGAAIDAQLFLFWDTKRPLNVNDSDLSQTMRELPVEHEGVTEMLFCSIRFAIGDCMRQLKKLEKSAEPGGASIDQLDKAIEEMENRLEKRFLKKCDPSIPLHLLATYLVRSSICSMRLSARHPRQFLDKGARLRQDEKDMLFALGLQVIVYDNLAYTTKSLEGYLWHVVLYFGFEAFILVLTELITRVEGEETDQAWTQVNQVYENRPELITESKNALYYAIGNLTLKAWDKRVSAARDHRPPYQPAELPCISKLRAQRVTKPPQTTHVSYSNTLRQTSQAGYGYDAKSAESEMRSSLEMIPHVYVPMDMVDLDWEGWQNLLDRRGDPSLNSQEQYMW
jgi:Fungal specific transcription factor domain